MNNRQLLQVDNQFFSKRFSHIVWATQIAFLVGVFNAIFLRGGPVFADNALGVRLDIAMLSSATVLTFGVLVLLRLGKTVLASSAYLWMLLIMMIIVSWVEGGLYSLAILSFPLMFVFSALFAELKQFLLLFITASIALVLFGLNHMYDWYPAPADMMVHGVARIVGGLVITVVSGYVAWLLGRDIKQSLSKLQQENQRVVESQKVIKQLAETDSLTGLLNRNAAENTYQKLLSGLQYKGEKIVFYFIDLDNFKDINDLFDHHAGDRLLITIADRLKALIGPEDVACRLGGDEFVVIVKTTEGCDFDGFAKQLIDAIAKPFSLVGTQVGVTASIGITVTNNRSSTFDDVRKKADMAMYKAKQSGKNKYHYYSSELDEEYMRNLNILTGLKDAVSNDLLDLHFQPKVSLSSDKIAGAEALLRWSRGNPHSIRPDEFIPIIESTELIHNIGAWVIQESCRACKQWHDAGHHITVAANVSALQLTRANFYDIVVNALEESGLEPHYLEIELTEHLLIQENKLVKHQLAALTSLGVSLFIDDFGTGYSNMNYLTRINVDALKLDKSFISQIADSDDYRVIVTAIIRMAQVLGMQVVAEGIETEAVRKLLCGLDCDYAQGYLWSKPVENKQFMDLLESNLAHDICLTA
ncbi:putative bifunctional diguanylate cyclase/phosphodiesterase [Leucothrix pacifica]|uniref:GGDEF-domain containing protein n=1 Tax=Leucothrix pacifica TaxID=1247513 RepID=A0A317CPY9_9GAMM|nr:GGDEF domain-containing phosphodiesterase [Leucothrix pacifica]PWR00258.1 hypothetical protein DKW60_03715 [Leucothrix pacifica]